MLRRYVLSGGLFLSSLLPAFCQNALAPRVLVVYVPTNPDSVTVASHYMQARGVPAANLCAISPTSPDSPQISASDYALNVKAPVRNCLNAVGAANILYIVLAYVRPIQLVRSDGSIVSMDSYLSDIWDQYTTRDFTGLPNATHGYYVDSQTQGNVMIPFQSLADYRASSKGQLLYAVWRLDGAAASVAMAQVDNAMLAEANGGSVSSVTGVLPNACIDLTAAPSGPDSVYTAANYDLSYAAQSLSAANVLNVVTDTLSTSFGNGASPNCLNTSFYAGWYNYGSYNNAFAWNPGSIGWDLDSGGLVDPRSGPWWGTGAIAAGITAVSGAVTEPYIWGLPRPTIASSLLQGANIGDAFLRNTRWLKWTIANVGDPLFRPFPAGVPSTSAALGAGSLMLRDGRSLSRQAAVGAAIAGIVSLPAPVAGGGQTFTLSVDNPVVALPESVTIPEGQTQASFTGTVLSISDDMDAQITASSGQLSLTNTITVHPLLNGLTFPLNPPVGGTVSEASSGSPIQAVMLLNGVAPFGGAAVQLQTSRPESTSVPSVIMIPAGQAQASFQIQTSAVTEFSPVTLTSTYGGKVATISIVLLP